MPNAKKDKERQEEEEVTEELKKLLMLEMARFSLFEEALLVIEAQNPNVEWYTKVTAAIQNPIQLYHVIYDTKRATTQVSQGCFVKRVDRRESSKEPEPVSSTSV